MDLSKKKDVPDRSGESRSPDAFTRACPTCGRDLSGAEFARQSFCSKRCREMDLMKWLNEEYRIPLEDHYEVEEGDSDERG